ncbi:MAG: Gfo/Idh/MocA family oxidoreductase, partial [Acidobacteriota bacterium]
MAQHHARAVSRLRSIAEPIAFADPLEEHRQIMRLILPAAREYASVEQLYDSERPDVVHICTPPATHEELASSALRAGAHVYIEKPVAQTVSGAQEILHLAKSRGLTVCAGHQLLFERPARRVEALLATIAPVVHVESYFSFRPVRRTVSGRAMPPEEQLLDVLPHPAYLLIHFLERARPGCQIELRALELDKGATLHGFVTAGGTTGSLVVTLEGRPVESYVRVVGTNGVLTADFVRGTTSQLIGPGHSALEKLLHPYRMSWQLVTRTTKELLRRLIRRERSYPGLAELLSAFYESIESQADPPITGSTVIETVRISEEVEARMRQRARSRRIDAAASEGPLVVVTGGTGFLGRRLVGALKQAGTRVRVIARAAPPYWEAEEGVFYSTGDVAEPLSDESFEGGDVIIHCAAATSGGLREHERDSIRATENIVKAAAQLGIQRLIHVSSLAVLAAGGTVSETTPLEPDPQSRGPYVWGKTISERRAIELGRELDIAVTVVRPGALVDYALFDPPGRLGKRLANLFVAVGSPRDELGVVDVEFAAKALVWLALNPSQSPPVLNLLAPTLPSKR